MKLQLALDDFGLPEAIEVADKAKDYIDIIEIGTPFVIDCGMEAVRQIAQHFPDKEVLADEKIMDGGYHEAALAFEAGAEYVTVLAVTSDKTIEGCVKAAKDYGKQVVVDMIGVKDLPPRVAELEQLGVDYLAVHTAVDEQAAGRTPLGDLKVMKECATSVKIAVAGGINASTIRDYVALDPEIIIVGSGIGHAADPAAAARLIKEAMN